MRILLVLTFVTMLARPAVAEQPADTLRPRATNARARLHKMQGRVLMSLGIIHLIGASIAGAVMLGEDQACRRNPECRNEDYVSPIAAFTMVGLGGLFSAVGVPLYVSGANGVARETAASPRPLVAFEF
jgi:uncharacterized iron-regulated membrane protein